MWWLLLLVAVWFLYSGDGNPIEGALNTLDMIEGRGARLTHYPADGNGLVSKDPQEMADEVGATVDAMAGARMLGSEEPHADRDTKTAIMWCLINTAAREGNTISGKLLRAKAASHDGFFGSQKQKDPNLANYNGSDRYATTALDAYEEDLAISQGCQDGTIPDNTGGATNFDRAKGEKNPAQVAANRLASGLIAYQVDAADPGLRFWGPA